MSCTDTKDTLYNICVRKNISCTKRTTKDELLKLLKIHKKCKRFSCETDIYGRFCVYINNNGIHTEFVFAMWFVTPPIDKWIKLIRGENVEIHMLDGASVRMINKVLSFDMGGDDANCSGSVDYDVAKKDLMKMWKSDNFRELYSNI